MFHLVFATILLDDEQQFQHQEILNNTPQKDSTSWQLFNWWKSSIWTIFKIFLFRYKMPYCFPPYINTQFLKCLMKMGLDSASTKWIYYMHYIKLAMFQKCMALTYLHKLRGWHCRVMDWPLGCWPNHHYLGLYTRLYCGCLTPGCKLLSDILVCKREVIDMGLCSCLLKQII